MCRSAHKWRAPWRTDPSHHSLPGSGLASSNPQSSPTGRDNAFSKISRQSIAGEPSILRYTHHCCHSIQRQSTWHTSCLHKKRRRPGISSKTPLSLQVCILIPSICSVKFLFPPACFDPAPDLLFSLLKHHSASSGNGSCFLSEASLPFLLETFSVNHLRVNNMHFMICSQ